MVVRTERWKEEPHKNRIDIRRDKFKLKKCIHSIVSSFIPLVTILHAKENKRCVSISRAA